MKNQQTNTSPSGITYNSIEEMIESIAEYKARQYKRVGFLESDDIKQEVRLKCFESLGKIDFGRNDSNVFGFLSRAADNRILDIRRKWVYKNNKPCTTCPFYDIKADKQNSHFCKKFVDTQMCDEFAAYTKLINAKKSANRPMDIDDNNVYVMDDNFLNTINNIDVQEFILKYLPAELHETYYKLAAFDFNPVKLNPHERTALIDALGKIFRDNMGESLNE